MSLCTLRSSATLIWGTGLCQGMNSMNSMVSLNFMLGICEGIKIPPQFKHACSIIIMADGLLLHILLTAINTKIETEKDVLLMKPLSLLLLIKINFYEWVGLVN